MDLLQLVQLKKLEKLEKLEPRGQLDLELRAQLEVLLLELQLHVLFFQSEIGCPHRVKQLQLQFLGPYS